MVKESKSERNIQVRLANILYQEKLITLDEKMKLITLIHRRNKE
ncbi:MAG: hypothetical protein UHW97_01245 [Frisingicoccus sp.]|nr:hypothetical protein [Frisingicoccus sp.]